MKKISTFIAMLFIASTVFSQDCSIGNTDGSDPNFTFGNFTANNLVGVNFTLSQVGVLNSLNMFGNVTSAILQMAIYDDLGGVPNNLVAYTGISAVQSGLNSLPVTPVQLEAGDYWIMAIYNIDGNHSNVKQSDPSSLVYYTPLPFSSPIPSNASAFLSYTGQDFLYFAEISCGPLSVNDFEVNKFTISPNPASDYLLIGNIKENTKFEIYDLSGKRLIEKELSISDHKIDITGLAVGTYLINYGTNSGIRFVKN